MKPSTFKWLNVTQFCGALNDNLFKWLITFYLTAQAAPEAEGKVLAIIGAVFVVPFLLFSQISGVHADKVSRQRIIVSTKKIELAIMVLGTIGFFVASEWMLYAVLFFMATQSAIFGPAKYGIVAELVGEQDLADANGQLSMFTFAAIVLGTVGATSLAALFDGDYRFAGLISLGLSFVGYWASIRIKKTPAGGGTSAYSLNFIKENFKSLGEVLSDRYLLQAILAGMFFWMVGAYLQLNLLPYGREAFDLSKENSAYLFLVAAVGIGVGSWIAGRVSRRGIEYGFVPVGAFLLGTMLYCLKFAEGNLPLACVMIFVIGIGSGLFLLPLTSFIQWRTDESCRSQVVGLNNFLNFVGILLASILLVIFEKTFGLSAQDGFALMGILTGLMLVLTLLLLPDFLFRAFFLLFLRPFGFVKVEGCEVMPTKGGVLLVAQSNRARAKKSIVRDVLCLMAAQSRRVRFVVSRDIYERPLWGALCRLLQMIPLSATDAPALQRKTMTKIKETLEKGEVVGVFLPKDKQSLSSYWRGFCLSEGEVTLVSAELKDEGQVSLSK